MLRKVFLFLLANWMLTIGQGFGEDWPHFLGPSRDGVYRGEDLAVSWPRSGLPVVWQKKVGEGFSGPVISRGSLILFHRVGGEESVEALDANTGKTSWSFRYPTTYRDNFGFDEGPRSTPAVAGGRVHTFGAEGVLHCLDLKTGQKIWSVDIREKFRAPKGFFGAACSPLVQGGALFLNVGGRDGAGLVAFDTKTGKILWSTTDDEAGYASPTAAVFGGRPHIVFFNRTGPGWGRPGSGRGLISLSLAGSHAGLRKCRHTAGDRRFGVSVCELRHGSGAPQSTR